MSNIADFNETEFHTLRTTLKERYGKDVELHLSDCEIRLDADSEALTECPAVFWQQRDANFVIIKTGDNRYRSQYFYTPSEQYGSGTDTFDNLADCIVTILQVQSDDESGGSTRKL